MDITVYLPDEIGQRAKAAELNLSGLLRAAVSDELERRAQVTKTLTEPQTYEIYLEDRDGRGYKGRITGAMLVRTNDDIEVYLTDDERVIVYDENKTEHWELDNPVAELRDWLVSDADYAEAMKALGESPVIDL